MLDTQGCRNPGGMGGYIPPNNLTKVYICIPPNNLTLVCMWITWIRGKKLLKDLFFWSSLAFGEKTLEILVKAFFFGLHIICWPEKYRDRGSSLPMLKIGQNWGKIANYSPQSSTKIGTPVYTDIIGAGFRGAKVPTPPLLVAVHLRGVAQNKNILKFFVL